MSKLIAIVFCQLRPKQWAKNFLCLVPILFSGKVGDQNAIIQSLLCFASFCAVSSAVYTVNDLVDVDSDRFHPVKRLRPIAAGVLSKFQALLIVFVCMTVGYYLSFAIRPSATLILAAYLALNLAYTFSWKRYAIIDVLCISIGFVLRAFAGSFAVQVQPSEWFLLCTTLGAIFLALEKRRFELKSLATESALHRASLDQYSAALLLRMENLVLPALITCYAFYSFLSFHGKFMMLTFPFLLYGIMRYQHLSEQGEMTGSPEDVFWKDRPIKIALLGWLIASLLVVYGDLGFWAHRIEQQVDSLKL